MTETAYIGIGSNLGNPQTQVERAINALRAIEHSELTDVSPLYRTAPMGQPGQDDYINAAACLLTGLAAEELLDALQAIENAQGRVRDGTRWGSRTLDLDILLFGDQVIATERLRVPHPEIANRAFVMEPLADLNAKLLIPEVGPLATLRMQVDRSDVALLST
ncbi:MAG: 2-amino-4-hydroxy-6-hydroxymethyldihydropteridine diphosphokinase [Pseudomonadota bacterium]